MKIEITNQQKIKKVNSQELKKYVRKTLNLLGASGSVSILLCDNSFMKKLNKKFFVKNHTTDVISFPLGDVCTPYYLGEVVVSVQEAVRLSKKYGNSWKEELLLYVIHGILHLVGYDDCTKIKKKVMERKQQQLLKLLTS
ncbi:MAG: rRNA maturation RNase YbeY [Candidatus Omnitrophota bacterium]|nr:MAG: rRNA maturation RNase YbeY [Candidatus Omnitrophota bacterium]